MPATVNSIVSAAEAEWKHWGSPTWNCITGAKSSGHHTDDENKFAQYVLDKYVAPFYKKGFSWPSKATISNDDYAWSAVAISFIMTKAGFTKKEFPISESHSTYIRWAIAARKQNDATAAYWGLRVDEAAAIPEVGDLIGYARAKKLTKAKALAYFDRKSAYNSHTDVIVAKRAGEIDVIGGNVRDSVTKKTLKIDANGLLIDQNHDWFVVMKRR